MEGGQWRRKAALDPVLQRARERRASDGAGLNVSAPHDGSERSAAVGHTQENPPTGKGSDGTTGSLATRLLCTLLALLVYQQNMRCAALRDDGREANIYVTGGFITTS